MSILSENTKARKDRQGLWIFLGLILFGAAVGAFVWHDEINRISYDEVGCPDTQSVSKLVFLIDTSDQISILQRLELRKRIDEHIRKTPINTRVTIYSLVPDEETHIRKVFDRCKPRDGSSANMLTENERRLERTWREDFAEPVKLIIDDALEEQKSNESPILEALQYVAVAEFNIASAMDTDVELIIGSDMLQNTSAYSHYRDPQDFVFYTELPYSRDTALTLPPISVRLLYIVRPGREKEQSMSHVHFWEQYFLNAGAMIESVNILPAGG